VEGIKREGKESELQLVGAGLLLVPGEKTHEENIEKGIDELKGATTEFGA
jgi:hypothetical protein